MKLPSLKSLFFVPRWRGLIYSFLTKTKSSSKAVIYRPLIFTKESIEWKEGLFVFHNARIEGVSTYCGISYDPVIIFDENVSIQQNCHITCANKIEIGANTAIAAGVTITDIDHPYDDINIPIEKQQLKVSHVKIGCDCKIYNHAVILKGTVIGNHCVVGANSVVKGIFSDFSIIVGSPARIVKRFNNKSQRWESTNSDGSFLNNEIHENNIS